MPNVRYALSAELTEYSQFCIAAHIHEVRFTDQLCEETPLVLVARILAGNPLDGRDSEEWMLELRNDCGAKRRRSSVLPFRAFLSGQTSGNGCTYFIKNLDHRVRYRWTLPY